MGSGSGDGEEGSVAGSVKRTVGGRVPWRVARSSDEMGECECEYELRSGHSAAILNNFSTLFLLANPMPARPRRSASRWRSAVVICGRPCPQSTHTPRPSPPVGRRRVGGIRFDGRCAPAPCISPAIREQRGMESSGGRAWPRGMSGQDARWRGMSHACWVAAASEEGGAVRAAIGQVHFRRRGEGACQRDVFAAMESCALSSRPSK